MKTTTKLPATLDEAEALDLVRKFFARFSGVERLAQHPNASMAAFALYMSALRHQPVEIRRLLVMLAKDGHPEAIDLLRLLLMECESRNIEPTLELKEYRMWLIEQGGPVRRRRSEADAYVLRDIMCIVIPVALILDRFPKIKATGNSPRRRNACEMVGEVLGMSYDNVRDIYGRYKKFAPTAPGWSRAIPI
jgi:hypothetical protein